MAACISKCSPGVRGDVETSRAAELSARVAKLRPYLKIEVGSDKGNHRTLTSDLQCVRTYIHTHTYIYILQYDLHMKRLRKIKVPKATILN